MLKNVLKNDMVKFKFVKLALLNKLYFVNEERSESKMHAAKTEILCIKGS